jgi:hypothetical protein
MRTSSIAGRVRRLEVRFGSTAAVPSVEQEIFERLAAGKWESALELLEPRERQLWEQRQSIEYRRKGPNQMAQIDFRNPTAQNAGQIARRIAVGSAGTHRATTTRGRHRALSAAPLPYRYTAGRRARLKLTVGTTFRCRPRKNDLKGRLTQESSQARTPVSPRPL